MNDVAVGDFDDSELFNLEHMNSLCDINNSIKSEPSWFQSSLLNTMTWFSLVGQCVSDGVVNTSGRYLPNYILKMFGTQRVSINQYDNTVCTVDFVSASVSQIDISQSFRWYILKSRNLTVDALQTYIKSIVPSTSDTVEVVYLHDQKQYKLQFMLSGPNYTYSVDNIGPFGTETVKQSSLFLFNIFTFPTFSPLALSFPSPSAFSPQPTAPPL